MSISIVTGGYIGFGSVGGGGNVVPPGPATIIAGPNAENIEELLPEIASLVLLDYVPSSINITSDVVLPSAVDTSYDNLKPLPVSSSTFVPKPISSSGN
jgi:hypothetical protein